MQQQQPSYLPKPKNQGGKQKRNRHDDEKQEDAAKRHVYDQGNTQGGKK